MLRFICCSNTERGSRYAVGAALCDKRITEVTEPKSGRDFHKAFKQKLIHSSFQPVCFTGELERLTDGTTGNGPPHHKPYQRIAISLASHPTKTPSSSPDNPPMSFLSAIVCVSLTMSVCIVLFHPAVHPSVGTKTSCARL